MIDKVFGTGSKGKNGILRAKGVCTCDEIGKCTCETKMNAGRKNKNRSTPQTPSIIIYIKHMCKNHINLILFIIYFIQ